MFVGVYAAFRVDNYREKKAGEERTSQVVETLHTDLKDYANSPRIHSARVNREP